MFYGHVLALRDQGFRCRTKMKKSKVRPQALRIAITGGIGCGKTEVARLLQRLGAAVWDADDAVHRLLQPGTRRLTGKL